MKVFYLMAALCIALAHAQERPMGSATATVHIVAVSVYGNPISPLWIDGFKDANGKEWANKFRDDGTASAIPYGEYELEAGSSTLPFCRAKVQVNGPDVWVTAAFEPPLIEEVGLRHAVATLVSGHIDGMPRTAAHCVLSGVYLDLRYETEVAPATAAFSFGEVVPGTYTLACLQNRKIILLQPVKVEGGQPPMEIKVGARLASE